MGKMRFKNVNPMLALVYAVLAMLCVMVSFQPILLAISFLALLSLGACINGLAKAASALKWQIPVIVFFALLNSLFVQSGSSVLFNVGPINLYVESLVYGASSGMMVVCVMSCFLYLSEVVSSDEVLGLFGGRMPVISLVTSMSIRLVPKFKRQASELDDVRKACTCANLGTSSSKHTLPSKYLTHLLAMSLEDSLVCADSMRSRGWGASKKRTSYTKTRMTASDYAILVLIVLLGLSCLIFAYASADAFQFYPVLAFSGLEVFDGLSQFAQLTFSKGQALILSGVFYLVYIAFFFTPHFVLFLEDLKWKR